jgi:NADPH:quinone reductase
MSSDQKEVLAVGVFTALEHTEYGDPASVLRLVERPMTEVEPGAHEALVRISKRPIHPGDLLMIAGDKRAGRAAPIPAGAARTPGFEGVGVIEKLGTDAPRQGQFVVGQRVISLSGTARTWATYSKVPVASLVAVPDEVSDAVSSANSHQHHDRSGRAACRTQRFTEGRPKTPIKECLFPGALRGKQFEHLSQSAI